ncbi:alpha/beta fold hydrolase [Terrimonas rubra]|uniref:Alpha/beta fold hydrolase n=1 Tax=Terrimonas rubra TaxID=1035890 RepID=A0ABW6A633_9BACT
MPYLETVVNGHKIGYYDEGKGPVVVLLHGFGEDATVWAAQIKLLQQNYRVIAPHFPGTAQSELTENLSMETMAQAVQQLLAQPALDVFPKEKIILIGHSMGGYVTLAFAEKYQELLKSWGLFHSTAVADSAEKKQVREKGIAFIEKNGAAAFIESTVGNLFSTKTKKDNPQLIKDFLHSMNNFSDTSLVSYYRAMINRPDRTAVLKNTTVPVLLVLGKDDQAIPYDEALKLAYMANKTYFYTLQQSGHMGMLEEEEKTNGILQEFIRESLLVSPA